MDSSNFCVLGDNNADALLVDVVCAAMVLCIGTIY